MFSTFINKYYHISLVIFDDNEDCMKSCFDVCLQFHLMSCGICYNQKCKLQHKNQKRKKKKLI